MRLIGIMLLLGVSIAVFASDFEKEKRWEQHIREGLLDGEPITLNDGNRDFFAIYTASTAEKTKKTAIILMHGIGVHPDWPSVINPLRVNLPEKGWTVLSLQLPVLKNSAKSSDYLSLINEAAARIAAANQYLQKKGYQRQVIIAHSLGAQMASHYITEHKPKLHGYIGIGMNRANVAYLSKMNLPILDLFGSDDLAGVLETAKARKQASSANKDYEQLIVTGVGHFFNGHEQKLIQVVAAWLNKYEQ